MILFSFDTESFLVRPGMQAPPTVCLQFKLQGEKPQLIHARDPACYRTLRHALEAPNVLLNGHNVAYDAIGTMATFPDLLDLWFDAYDADRVVCTMVRQKLKDIASGQFKFNSKRFGYNLEACAKMLGVDAVVNKQDPYRLRYGELYGTPVSEWPPEAVSYAIGDVVAQEAVYLAQPDSPDQFRQTRGALWLKLMSCWGIQVDLARAEDYMQSVRKGLDHDREICQGAGLVRPDGSRDIKVAAARMTARCVSLGVEPPETKTGNVALDEDAVILYGDEELEAYQSYTTGGLQVSRAERLAQAGRTGLPVQSYFGELQDTGRPSCSQGDKVKAGQLPSSYSAQLFNPAKDKKVTRKDGTTFTRKGTREIYVARPGKGFITTDWEGAEASALAQLCIWNPTIGFSKLGDIINAGGNLPTEFGALIAGITKEQAYALKGTDAWKPFNSGDRQAAKIALYGYFANMGPDKLALQARKQYRVKMTSEDAARYKMLLKSFAPELPLYWAWGQAVCTHPTGRKNPKTGRPETLCPKFVQPWSGRVRGMMSYTEVLNNGFQALVSDLFKLSGWRLAFEMYTGRYWDRRPGKSPMYGCRKVNAPYDDFLTECPLDRLTEVGQRQCEIMTETTREVCPDVAFRVSPAACRRWYKDAETVRDPNGNLLLWEPSV